MATARQARLPLQLGHASPHLSGAVPDAALLLLVRSEFVCWHGLWAAWRIDQYPGHAIVMVDLPAFRAYGATSERDSKGKLGGEEIPLTFGTDPEFRKTPVGGRFDC